MDKKKIINPMNINGIPRIAPIMVEVRPIPNMINANPIQATNIPSIAKM